MGKRISTRADVLKHATVQGECWIWNWRKRRDGYGSFGSRDAHRVIYERLVGPVPEGLVLDHLCRNRACVNPAHLEPVTRQTNTKRGSRASVTHCPKGHPYDERNTYHYKGRRNCRTCNRQIKANGRLLQDHTWGQS